VIVAVPAVLDEVSVTVAVPDEPVVAVEADRLPESVENVTVSPLTPLPSLSVTVAVIVVVLDPSAEIVDEAAVTLIAAGSPPLSSPPLLV